MEEFNFKFWWNLLGAAGAAIVVASATASFVPGFLVGLGILAVGVGEWHNHPRRTEIITGKERGTYIKHGTNPWKPKLFGLIVDAIGIVLFCWGLYRLAFGP
jgi:hypothetical protein